jgi:hypothetical protein
MTLINRGANGCVCGDDMRLLEGSERYVDVSGSFCTVYRWNITVPKSMISCYNYLVLNSGLLWMGTKSRLRFALVLPIWSVALQRMPRLIRYRIWFWRMMLIGKTSYDNVILDLHKFYDVDIDNIPHGTFDAHGNYLHCTVTIHLVQSELGLFDVHKFLAFDDIIADTVDSLNPSLVDHIYQVNNRDICNLPQDHNRLRPCFAWAPADTIQKTVSVTTQYARGRVSKTMWQPWKSRFPACNVRHRNEALATDTIFSDTPAVDSGVKAAQLFIGRSSLIADVYGVKTDKQFVNTLEDNIRERGAMDKLVSDCARAETSNCIKDILCALVISDWQSEPYHKNQNFY